MPVLSIESIDCIIMDFLMKISILHNFIIIKFKKRVSDKENRIKRNSHTGTRTRVAEVKTRYPNRLDYMGPVLTQKLVHFRD